MFVYKNSNDIIIRMAQVPISMNEDLFVIVFVHIVKVVKLYLLLFKGAFQLNTDLDAKVHFSPKSMN